MPSKAYVIGVGMTKFEKPGSRENFDYPQMAKESGTKALKDAGITYDQIEQAFVGYVFGDSTSGQRAVYELGLTGIPIVNVNNNCSTGSTALLLAKNVIESGASNCVLALGFEKMQRGSLSSTYSDRCNPIEKHVEVMSTKYEMTAAPMMAQMFGNAGRDYLKKYNITDDGDAFARIAHKNHKHSVNNPYAQFRKEYSLEEVKGSPSIHSPLTKLQCSPTSDGSAAAIIASEEFVIKHNLQHKAVEIMALEMATDLPNAFIEEKSDCMKLVGFEMSQLAARKAFQKAGIKPQDVQVVELHDCFSANELITYEAIGLCEPGKAVDMVKNNDNTYGGKYVVNPSGGLISKGHPLGATGIAQCSELCWQLRGQADKRQVKNVKYALQHNIGLGGAAVVGIYRLGFPGSRNVPAESSAKSEASPLGSDLKAVTSQLKSGQFFDEFMIRLNEDGPAMISKVKAIIGFDVRKSPTEVISYICDMKNAPGGVSLNDGTKKADVTIQIADEDLVKILEGKLNMMSAFTQKKVKLVGNMSVAMRLNQIFAQVVGKGKPLAKPAAAAAVPTAAVSASKIATSTTKHKSGVFFEEVESKLNKEGAALVKQVGAIIGFEIACANNEKMSYVIDLKNGSGAVSVGIDSSAKPGCTILISDDDLLNIVNGKLNMMTAFTSKKLKITGNMSIAMKLNALFSSILKTKSKL
jgi:sterol carrier protein 2